MSSLLLNMMELNSRMEREKQIAFPGATVNDLSRDEGLQAYLREGLAGMQVAVAPGDLRAAVLLAAEKTRGGFLWETVYGVPKEYPRDDAHFRLLNLIERIYLSAPEHASKTALYTLESRDREQRDAIVAKRAMWLYGAPALVAGAGFWWLSRRRKQLAQGPIAPRSPAREPSPASHPTSAAAAPAVNFCSGCGTKLQGEKRFCHLCGAPQQRSTA